MATLEDLQGKIEEYITKYRREDLPKIKQSGVYGLYPDIPFNGQIPSQRWPELWPYTNQRGIYAIFNHEKLLYIGKASQQDIGYRLSSYFKYGEDKKCHSIHKWSNPPTHIVVWAVPEGMFFEASALEEFLINELKDDLPDNTAGKNV
jgi:hypothetical protein